MGSSKFIWASSPMDHGTPKPEDIMKYKEEQEAHLTTRQWYAKEARDDALLDGWRACLARILEKEEADINNKLYRQGEKSK